MAVHPAAYEFKVNKVTISGTCFNGLEEWSTGFYLGHPNADAPVPGPLTASNIAEHWSVFFAGVGSKVSTAYKTTQVKVSRLELDGDVELNNIDIYDYPVAIAGQNGGAPMPPQITLAATLTSDLQRGLASKGRMYLPGINVGIQVADPRISDFDRNAIRDGLKVFFDAVNADVDVSGAVILASKGRKIQDGVDPNDYHYEDGVTTFVTGLRVGNVYDTQRRRRNDLVESYGTAVLAAP